MWVAKVNQIIGSSPTSFEDAVRTVVIRANRTLRGITGIEVIDKSIKVEADAISEYRVRMRLIFDMVPKIEPHW
jgi:flavin-binding protein dodecin